MVWAYLSIYENGGKQEMNLSQYFKSIIDEDKCAVVICNLEHEIIYMNPAAADRYAKSGGARLVGQSLLDCHGGRSQEMIRKVAAWFADSADHNRIYTFHNEKENRDVYMVALRDEDGTLIGYYEKHEYRNAEESGLYQFD
jgi:PAS domain-containing protein